MALRVFKNLDFQGFVKNEDLTDEVLWKAIAEVESGLVDARLGGFLIKKRVPRPGGGKSGGYRTIMAHRQGERLFLLYGFAKNERDNITRAERAALLEAGNAYMKLTDTELDSAVEKKVLLELKAKKAK
jgi:hypothetical protein